MYRYRIDDQCLPILEALVQTLSPLPMQETSQGSAADAASSANPPSAASSAAAAAAAAVSSTYTVKSGDVCSLIAQYNGVSLQQLENVSIPLKFVHPIRSSSHLCASTYL